MTEPTRRLREHKGITIDRNVLSGDPVISGRRIPTRVIAGRFMTERIEVIAADYHITEAQVYDALRFELKRARNYAARG